MTLSNEVMMVALFFGAVVTKPGVLPSSSVAKTEEASLRQPHSRQNGKGVSSALS